MRRTVENPVRIDQQTLNKYKPDGFSLPFVLKRAGATREYNFAGQWGNEKPGKERKPQGTRVVFKSVEDFRAARDVYFAWQELMEMKSDNPVQPEKALQRLLDAKQSPFMPDEYDRQPLCLFVPWGVRPKGRFGEPEKDVMQRIREVQETLWRRNINAQVLIMPADLYATEVNRQVATERANEYFTDVTLWANVRGFFVKPWSAIRKENKEIYDKRAAELSEDAIRDLLPYPQIEEAITAATRRSGYYLRGNVQRAAFAYLRERICEAEIVEATCRPIKVSVVAKNKDNSVDRELPRLYVIPRELQFPWLI